MNEWKKVKIDFDTMKLRDFIEPVKTKVSDIDALDLIVYGVTNKDGICETGKTTSEDISNYIVLEENCFVFNPYRINVGSIGINDKNLKGCVSPAYVVFKTKNGLLPEFLFYYMKSDYGNHLINFYGNRGGVRNALRYSDLCNIDIPDITKINQHVVVDKLNNLFEKLKNLTTENETQSEYIKKLRQSILQDAIEGKLTTEWRKDHPVIKGNPDFDAESLFEKIQQEKQKTLAGKKQKQLPPIADNEKPFKIPDSWKWVRLGEIGVINRGSGIKRCDIAEQGQPCILYGELYTSYGLCCNKTYSFITSELFARSKHFSNNAVVFTLTGENREDIAKSCAYLGEEIVAASGDLAYWEKHCLDAKYLSFFMATQYFSRLKQVIATGDFIIHISTEKLKSVPLILPPLAEQEEIVRIIDEKFAKLDLIEQEIKQREIYINNLKQSVMREVFEE